MGVLHCQEWTRPSFLLGKLGSFTLFKLQPLLWGTCYWKLKLIYLKCYKGSNQTLSIYAFLPVYLQGFQLDSEGKQFVLLIQSELNLSASSWMEDLENIQNNGMVTTPRQAQSIFFIHISDYSYLPTIGSRHVQDGKEALSPETFRYSKGFMAIDSKNHCDDYSFNIQQWNVKCIWRIIKQTVAYIKIWQACTLKRDKCVIPLTGTF